MLLTTPDKVVAMSVLLMCGRGEGAGLCSGWGRCAVAHSTHHPGLPACFMFVLMACAVVHAEESSGLPPFSNAPPVQEDMRTAVSPPPATAPAQSNSAADTPSLVPPRMVVDSDDPDLPVPVHASGSIPPAAEIDHVAINIAAIDRARANIRGDARQPVLHLDDATTATGPIDDVRMRSMALALDAPLSRSGSGLTLQSRVEMAYRPGVAAVPGNWDPPPGEASATGLSVRLYGSKPTRLNGVYPFVEADWWQDNRAKTININGTRIDTDLLRGLLSFNIGAHSSSTTGLRLWVKARGGRNAGGTIGARYRW